MGKSFRTIARHQRLQRCGADTNSDATQKGAAFEFCDHRIVE
jgi:hypothetical protein